MVSVLTYTSPPGATTVTFGMFQVALALLLLGVSGKPLIAAIILASSLRYAMNGLYELTGSTPLQTVSGVFGLLVFAFALYGGLALALEDTKHRPILPFGRRGEALEAVEGDLSDQIGPIEREAGVRKQL